MKNILYISLFGQIGGGEVSLLVILRNLDRGMFTPYVICYTDGPLIKKIRELNIKVIVLNRGGFLKSLADIARIVWYIRKHQIALVHVNSLDIRSGIAAFLSGVPFVGHLRVIFPYNWRDCLFAGLSSKVIAVSGAVVKEFGKKCVTRKNKFIVIPNAVDDPGNIAPSGLRREYALDQGVSLIGSVGRIDPWKGYEYFIEAAWLLKQEAPSCAFFIMGDIFMGDQDEAEYLARLKKRVAELGMEGYFFFTGFRDDILNAISALDILVIPSIEIRSSKGLKTEGFGRTAIEGMMVKTAVVASAIGGLKEIIEDRVSGFLVTPGDPEQIKSALLRLLTDKELRARITSEAWARFEKLYTVRKQMELVVGVYNEIIANKE